MTTTRFLRTLAPVLALVALTAIILAGGAVMGCGSSSGSSGAGSGGSSSSNVGGLPAGGSSGFEKAAPSAADGAVNGGDSSSIAADLPVASGTAQHYLVRNGSLSIEVARGSLLGAVDRISAFTTAMNGYVVSSSVGSAPIPWPAGSATDGQTKSSAQSATTSSGDGYATIIVRVPGDGFNAALDRYARLGHVQSVATSSDDVTTQYVDLQARLDHYRAVSRRLVRFLGATHTISQMLAVQDRIDNVQLTVERLTAELKSLRETTTYGTITIELTEKGAQHAAGPAGTSFWGTFTHSLWLLGRGLRGFALALIAVLPFVVLLGVLATGGWIATQRYRRRHEPAQKSASA